MSIGAPDPVEAPAAPPPAADVWDLPDVGRRLPGSGIRFRETDNDLLLLLPPRTRRAVIIGALLTLLLAGILAGLYLLQPPIVIGVVASAVCVAAFALALLVFAGANLAKTYVRLARDRLTVITIAYGQTDEQQHELAADAYAKQHWSFSRRRRRGSIIGIDVVSGDNTVHFGDLLARGELDWVEWRINRFLGQPTHADPVERDGVMLIEDLPSEPAAPPKKLGTRVEETFDETRITFPSSYQRGSYKGVGTAVLGTAWTAFWTWRLFSQGDRALDAFDVVGPGFIALVGAFVALGGLVRFCGLSRLRVSPRAIRFQTTLLGVGPRWKIPTAEVLSVGGAKDPRNRAGKVIGGAKGRVIRSARREIRYGYALKDAARSKEEREWVSGEIALRIYALRTGAAVPSIRHRLSSSRAERPKAAAEAPRLESAPYDLTLRAAPTGSDLDALLPQEVGPFRRKTIDEAEPVGAAPSEVEYQSPLGGVSVSVSAHANAQSARDSVGVADAEIALPGSSSSATRSLNTEPSYCRHAAPGHAFMAWTRDAFCFTVEATGDDSPARLDRFMQAFPY